ncbi:MAG: redoxin domain-containing protein [Rhodospirillales bacterium]|nr:MAG: redoxin domain-containing protein [Rhodospirillales bacterium]
MTMVIPGTRVPRLDVALVGGGRWTLEERAGERFAVIEFYRGLHCPRCARRLQEIDARLDELARYGATFFALSTDTEERARRAVEEWRLANLAVGYGISIDEARCWGLVISESIAEKEPYPFCEPGLFIVRPDGELYLSFLTTAPFLRPDYDMLMECLDFTIRRDYPPRGTLG